MLGKIERRRRGQQRMRWLDSITDSMDIHLNKFQEIVEGRGAWHTAVHGVEMSRTGLSGLILPPLPASKLALLADKSERLGVKTRKGLYLGN